MTSTVDVGGLFQEHAPLLLRLVERLTGPGDHVRDIVQETFLLAHRKRDQLDPSANLRGWLYRVAVNLCQHHRRTMARQARLRDSASHETPAAPTSPHGSAEQSEQARRIHACLQKLSPKHQEVLVLYELEGEEGAEIAAMLDIPLNTVWTRLHHARKAFRERWDRRAS